MKYFLSLLVTVSALCTSLSAVEYGTLVSENVALYEIVSEKIILNDGDKLEIINVLGDSAYFRLFLKDVRLPTSVVFSENNELSNAVILRSYNSDTDYNDIFVGPAEVFIVQMARVPNTNSYRVSYKLTRASEVEYKNANIVSLPTSAVGQGTHEIVVEASDDLQSWTPVHSSSIGGNKTFFRTRVLSLALGAEPAD